LRDIIPQPVYDAIWAHLTQGARNAVSGWDDASEDEDTLTGDFGALLRIEWSRPIAADGETWRWRVRYKKFRGRGGGALERETGADGIFQIEVTRGDEKAFKGLLFQAKKLGGSNGRLSPQVERMESLAPGSSAVFEYGPPVYRAASGQGYLQAGSPSLRHKAPNLRPLDSFLGDEFLPCNAGHRGLYYDALRGLLLLPTGTALRVSVRHRVTIEAEEFRRNDVETRSSRRGRKPPRAGRRRRKE